MKRQIAKYPTHKILTEVAVPVTEFGTTSLDDLIRDMCETMLAFDGCGLAAPQVHVGQRLMVFEDATGTVRSLVNPVIAKCSGRHVANEGCLSLPGFYAPVCRSIAITVESQSAVDGSQTREGFTGLPARIIQHEIDHLNGRLFLSRVVSIKKRWEIESGIALRVKAGTWK